MPLFTPAVKEQLKARVAIDGPTGAGKTWTALQWARIIAGPTNKVAVIDTENRSAAYYAPAPGWEGERVNWWDPPYEFLHLPVSPPYSPVDLRNLIRSAASELDPNDVLLIDSGTHYWSGEGGTLDIVDDATARSRSRNSFSDGWKEGTPAQRAMIDAIVHAPFHVIFTMRSKMAYVMEERSKDGKTYTQPRKVGLQPEQRAGVEYEFTVVIDMDLEHQLIVSKSRCDLIADVVMPGDRSAEVAQTFADWLATGVQRIADTDRQAIVERFRTIEDEGRRRTLWDSFVTEFGRLSELPTDRLGDVTGWLDRHSIGTAAPAAPESTLPAPNSGQPANEPAAPAAPKRPRKGGDPVPVAGALAEAVAQAVGESPAPTN